MILSSIPTEQKKSHGKTTELDELRTKQPWPHFRWLITICLTAENSFDFVKNYVTKHIKKEQAQTSVSWYNGPRIRTAISIHSAPQKTRRKPTSQNTSIMTENQNSFHSYNAFGIQKAQSTTYKDKTVLPLSNYMQFKSTLHYYIWV
jgi:hypothetical protein